MTSTIVLALSFGKGNGRGANKANKLIAEKATSHAKTFNTFIFADASVPVSETGCDSYRIIGSGCKMKHESTVTLLESALSLYEDSSTKEEIRDILIFTAPQYLARVVRDGRKIFKNTDVFVHGTSIFWEKWFYPDSTQLWTTSFWFWWPRELLIKALPWKAYYWLSKNAL
ncbi:MAG: hypothetical protein WAV31_01140 [Candidatus Moraniibacteriota bacterium]